MVSARRGVIVALIIGSIVGGAGGATIISAASASQATHERTETAQREVLENGSGSPLAVGAVTVPLGS
jgi:hypothetical protein